MRDWLYWIWLAQTLGPGCDCRGVIGEYGEPRRFYEEGASALKELCGRRILSLSENRREQAEKCFGDDALDDAKRIFERVYKLGLSLAAITDGEYPALLRRISNPPALLYIKGGLTASDASLTIGVVGSRNCCEGSAARTRGLCRELSEGGATVVSGLAQGIDTAAARAVTEAGHRTIAVVGCGLDIVYPIHNTSLFYDIAENGAVISEYPPGSPPVAMHFPQRNRIISGMSSGVVVVEAGAKSGALITAREAKKQGRDVFVLDCFEDGACRGDFQGCRLLIKQGAVKISCASDIFGYYGETGGMVQGMRESWEDRYLAWDGADEPDGFDEPEWIAENSGTERRKRQERPDGEVSRPAGVRVMLPEDWPEAPRAAGDPKAKEFGRFLSEMTVGRGKFGATVLSFDGYERERPGEEGKKEADAPQKEPEPRKNKEKKRGKQHIAPQERHITEETLTEETPTEETPTEETPTEKVPEECEGPLVPDVAGAEETGELSEAARRVLKEVKTVPQGMEELSGRLDMRIDKLAAALAELEINGFVVSQPGARYMLPKKR